MITTVKKKYFVNLQWSSKKFHSAHDFHCIISVCFGNKFNKTKAVVTSER